jgi:hypothetical protein
LFPLPSSFKHNDDDDDDDDEEDDDAKGVKFTVDEVKRSRQQ